MQAQVSFKERLLHALKIKSKIMPPDEVVEELVNVLPSEIKDVLFQRLVFGKTFVQMHEESNLSATKLSRMYYEGLRMLNQSRKKLDYIAISKYEYQKLIDEIQFLRVMLDEYSTGVDIDKMSIYQMNLSTRTTTCLSRAGILHYYELRQANLNEIRNLGKKSRMEVIEKMKVLEELKSNAR